MLNVYCISGMGVNEEMFRNMELKNCTIHHIKWITPHNGETLSEYAMRLANRIDTTQPFALIGVSFGGMCCIEIAKKLTPVKVFLVSSCKTRAELPAKIKIWSKIPLYKKLSDNVYKKAASSVRVLFGVTNKEQGERFKRMLNTAPENYYKGAVHCILAWMNSEIPKNVIHIHGTADQVLPYKKIVNCNYTIKDGTHFMIVNKAEEINAIINKELKNS
ncbi:MAG: alpha/beta hydrolase [Bacteroidota bacterium]